MRPPKRMGAARKRRPQPPKRESPMFPAAEESLMPCGKPVELREDVHRVETGVLHHAVIPGAPFVRRHSRGVETLGALARFLALGELEVLRVGQALVVVGPGLRAVAPQHLVVLDERSLPVELSEVDVPEIHTRVEIVGIGVEDPAVLRRGELVVAEVLVLRRQQELQIVVRRVLLRRLTEKRDVRRIERAGHARKRSLVQRVRRSLSPIRRRAPRKERRRARRSSPRTDTVRSFEV